MLSAVTSQQYQRQLTFDFDAASGPKRRAASSSPAKQQPGEITDLTGLLPVSENKNGDNPPPPLVRPDRQIVYADATTHFAWPNPNGLHNRHTITVDRITNDIDIPSHRFVICRGEAVEVFFKKDKREVGVVCGICHKKEEVCVLFGGCKNGIWFHKGQIYPAPDKETVSPTNEHLAQVSEIVDDEKDNNTQSERLPDGALSSFQAFRKTNVRTRIVLIDKRS